MKKGKIIFIVITILVVASGIALFMFKDQLFGKEAEAEEEKENKVKPVKVESKYQITSNSLTEFDLFFLQNEYKEQNIIYSPLSIKYALAMLQSGASGETKEQIESIIGSYIPKKTSNTANMSFANAMFIKDTYKDSVKSNFINLLEDKYNANIIYDSFQSPNNLNSWVKNKTLGLINNVYDDITPYDFILLNALGIDMEWNNVIQVQVDIENDFESKGLRYSLYYEHEGKTDEYAFWDMVEEFDSETSTMTFNHKTVTAPRFAAAINNYDIISTLGEDNIRNTVKEALHKWKEENPSWEEYSKEYYEDEEAYLDKYIEEISKNYQNNGYSTDFYLYDDENVKVFAKDLKTYNDTTLQYLSIMPKKDTLKNYIDNLTSSDLNNIITNLKDASNPKDFKEGYFTHIRGIVPLFNFDYELDLKSDLQKLGITNIFDEEKVDLTNISDANAIISDASHKATINFSNEGIKAGAVSSMGGSGAGGPDFDYYFAMPTIEIDLTFDRPYMFLIRDKQTGEVWFAGSVYE